MAVHHLAGAYKKNYTVDHHNCLGGGRYCDPDPLFAKKGNLTGRNSVYMDLRVVCIH